MENSNIQDDRITSPASHQLNYPPRYARLSGHFAWCTSRQAYLQIDLGRMYKLTAIATQGGGGPDKWVKRYKIGFKAGPTFVIYSESGPQKVCADTAFSFWLLLLYVPFPISYILFTADQVCFCLIY